MRKLTITLFSMVFLAFATVASAQTTDHWETSEQCMAAQDAPFYYPTLLREQKLAQNEVTGGLPRPACVDMNLPDRLGGRGWVRIGDDRKVIFSRETGRPVRLAECNNEIFGFILLPSLKGEKGDRGEKGERGEPGYTPIKGLDYFDGKDGRDWGPTPTPVVEKPRSRCGKGCKTVIGVAAGIGIYYLTRGHGGGHRGPGGITGGNF